MGTTAHLALPYPEGADLVIAGDDAIQALAEAVDSRIEYSSYVSVGNGESGQSGSGTMVVDFFGPQNILGWSTDGYLFTYNGTGGRYFMVAAHVEVDSAPGGVTAASAAYLHQDGVEVCSSYDEISVDAGSSINRRRIVHHLTSPVYVSPGQFISVTCAPSGTASLGVTSLRIYPIGPVLA